MNESIIIFEMFAGYGGASWGLELAGIPYECIGYSEIDKYAQKIYDQNFPDRTNYGDCTQITPEELPNFNLLTGGFPCPSFSIAGEGKGFDDPRGQLFYEIIRIAQVAKPKYMLLENTCGLLSNDNGKSIKRVLRELRGIGYDVCMNVLDPKEYGVPQTRKRVWFLCKLGQWEFMECRWPTKQPLIKTTKEILEKNISEKYYVSDKVKQHILNEERLKKVYVTINPEFCQTQTARQYTSRDGTYIADFRYDEGLRIRKDGCCPTLNTGCGEAHTPMIVSPILTPNRKEKRQNGRRIKEDNDPMFTITAQDNHGVLIENESLTPEDAKNIEIRMLTPREQFRFMGFLNDEINIDGVSDRQLYKMSGNGWDVNLVSLIFKQLYKK